jgi:hypothetical protein
MAHPPRPPAERFDYTKYPQTGTLLTLPLIAENNIWAASARPIGGATETA